MELIKLTPAEFKKVATLIYDRTGIHLPDSKITLLSNRLRKRLRALSLPTFEDYYKLINDPKRCEDELPHFLSAVTTNETYFFRNEKLWTFFQQKWIPEMVAARDVAGKRTLRLWSAASSSGEEAYTAAICLRENLRNVAAWDITIVGTDISTRVLDRAKAGEYNAYAISKLPGNLLGRCFVSTGDVHALKPEVRRMVKFEFHNLRDPLSKGGFDFIFLRNVLMYFDNTMKLKVVRNAMNALAPGGYLYVGDVDPIRNVPELSRAMTLEYLGPNLYHKPDKTALVAAGSTGGR